MPRTILRRKFLKNSISRLSLTIAIALPASLSLIAGCTSKQTAKQEAKRTPVYVRIDDLTGRHPLQATLHDIETAEKRLQQDAENTTPVVSTSPLTLPATVSVTTSVDSDIARDRAARARFIRNAQASLNAYADTLETIRLQFAHAHSVELEAVARANSAASENQERQKIIDKARSAQVDRLDADGNVIEKYGRAYDALNTRVRRDAIRTDLREGNVISVARESEAPYARSEKVLETQIAKLNAQPSPSPSPSSGAIEDNKKPVVSDEARLNKMLRDLESSLRQFAADNKTIEEERIKAINEAIARIQAENAAWVADQLAKSPWRSRQLAELTKLREELSALTGVLKEIAVQSATGTQRYGAAATGELATATIPAPDMGQRAITTKAISQLEKQRDSLRQTIRRDTETAVRDAATVRGLEPVFLRTATTQTLPDRTNDFRRWIFPTVGNVRESTMSKEK